MQMTVLNTDFADRARAVIPAGVNSGQWRHLLAFA
jgi:hypothetical protein